MTLEYIAGFFDGEGSVMYSSKYRRGKVTISQTNEEVLLKIKDFLGFGKVYKVSKRKVHWKDAWVYNTNIRKECIEFINLVSPFLIVKKEQALSVKNSLEILESNSDVTDIKNKALNLIDKGFSYREIEKILHISRSTISRYKKQKL